MISYPISPASVVYAVLLSNENIVCTTYESVMTRDSKVLYTILMTLPRGLNVNKKMYIYMRIKVSTS